MDGALDYIFGALSIVLSVMGLIIILGFRRDRLIASFVEAVAAEVLLWAHSDGSSSDAGASVPPVLLVRQVPDQRWGWWKRRWRELHTFPPWRMKHYRFVLLVRRPDNTYHVVLLRESQRTRREAIDEALKTYDYEPLSAEHSVDDESAHAIVPLDGGHYLIVEPALTWPRNRKARVPTGISISTDPASQAAAAVDVEAPGSRKVTTLNEG